MFYKNGKEDGVSRRYYEDGNIKSEYSYRNGKKEGIGKIYYKNGKLQSEEEWKEGKRTKVLTSFDIKGKAIK